MAVNIQLVDGRVIQFPDGTDPKVIEETARKATQNPLFGVSTQELKEAPSAPSKLKDVGIAALTGLAGGAQSLTDLFGAGNIASRGLSSVQQSAQEGLSEARKAEIARDEELKKRAEGSFLDEAGAGFRSFANAPLQEGIQALFSSAPIIAAGALTGGAGAVPLTAARAGLAARAAQAGRVATSGTGVGAAMGLGGQKGQDYETVKRELMNRGMPEPEAEAKAQEAAAYSLQNLPRQAVAAGAGALEGRYGVEGALSNFMKQRAATAAAGKAFTPELPPGYGKAAVSSIFGEVIPEGIQAATGQVGTNIALTQAGIPTDALQGVTSAVAHDAAVAALLGTAVTPFQKANMVREFNQTMVERQQKAFEEEAKRREEFERKRQEEIAKTRQELGIQEKPPLLLESDLYKDEKTGELKSKTKLDVAPPVTDPLINPLGNLTKDELGQAVGVSDVYKFVDNYRRKNNLPKLETYSIEDLKDAQPGLAEVGEKGSLESILTFKTGYEANTPIAAENVLNTALQKNVETGTKGWNDFLARTTGNNSLDTMSGPELLAVSQALNRLPDPKPESAPIILPEGTNAKLFKQSQYDQAISAVDTALSGQGLSLTPGPMTEQATLDVIKQATGLTLDKHAKAILDTAVKQGDFDLEMTPKYEVTDPATGVRVGDLYETRTEAQAAAKPKGLNVNEITESAVVAPKTATTLPDEFDIQEGEFKAGEAPESFDIMAGNTVLANTASYEDAAGRIEGFTKIRQRMADQALAKVTKLQEEIANSQSDLEQMEAKGQANTQEYINARGAHAKLLKEQEVKTNEAFDEADKYNPETNPISIKPRKLAPVRRRGLTVLQKGIPSATFPTRTAAEEHIIANMSDQQLKKLTKTKGRRTLAKRALAELQAREDKKAGVTKGFAVKRSEIEAEPEVSQEVKDKIAELEKFLLPALRKLGLNDVALKIEQSIAGGRAGGSYYESLIKIAMDEENPLLTMRHEALHALKALGFFTPQQWATLERKARTEWVNKYLRQRNVNGGPIQPNENSRYYAYELMNIIEPTVFNEQNPDQPQRTVMSQADFMDLIIEEAIADAFADFTVNKPPPGMIAALMQRLNKFFEALRNAMAGAGFQTVDDIFGKVEAGELKALGQGPAGAKTKLSVTAEKVEEVDPKNVGNIVTNSAYKDAGINVLGSQIEKTSKPLEVDDVGKLFDDAYMAEFGKAGDWRNPVDFKRAVVQAVDELKVQMQQAKSGLDWYDEDVAEAFKLTQRYIPSLKNPEKRALFSVIAGIMSPSTNARDNWVIAAQAYQHYEKTGTLPGTNPATGGLWMGGLESANKKKQLDMLNAMLQPKSKGGLGEKGAVEWLQGVHTVAEITSFRSKYGGMGKSSTGGKATDILPGFTAFGPKVGPFVMNINGIHEVTVDVWMTRTFNRYFGQMMGPDGKMVRAPTEPQRVAIKNLAVLAAQQLGIKPYQVQSMLWFMEQQIFNKLGTGAKSYGFSDGATKFSETQGGVGVSKVPPANIGANATANKPTRKQAVGSGVQAGKLSVRSTGQEVTDENIRSAKPAIRPGDQGGRRVTEDQSGRGNRGGRDSGRGTTPLAGAPTVQGATGPDPEIVSVAEAYAAKNNIPYSPQESYVEVDEDRARRLAQAYEDMPHAPKDPAVQAAYKDLAEQTRAQYDALIDAGYKFTFFDSETDPYDGNPWNAMRDLRQNKQMAVYGTYDGFGTEGLTDTAVEDNPMLEDTGLRWEDQNGVDQIVTANDLFRAVHDAFGHGLEGAGFRARGEENAWQAHARLFTGPALAAITSETRGQNSWLNYGPYAEKNQNAKVQDTVFAEQKTGLMPDWTWTEGLPKLSVRGKQGVVLGTLQPGAASFKGAHYGNAKVDTLNGDKYGTGIRGAERRRLDETGDDRIRRRVYFYVAKEDGTMPTPEAGLGQYVYTQQFDNILPPGAEMSKLYSQANANSNQFESAVVDAGYDGYAIPNMGMMVVLNHNAPVEYRGTRVEMAERGEKLSIRPPPLVGRIAPNTPEFKRFFDGSKAINDDGSPRLMFHGTVETPGEEGNLFSAFNLSDDGKLGSGVYTTSVPVYAETFGFSQPALMPLYLSAKNPYYIELGDFPTRMKGDNLALTDDAFNALETQMKEAATKLSGKRLMDLEGGQVRKMFEKAGYDSIIARDSYGNIIEALAFKPEQVKSATGNVGTYDPTNPDIRLSVRNIIGDQKVIDAYLSKTTAREEKGHAARMLDAITPPTYTSLRQMFLNQYDSLARLDNRYAKAKGIVRLMADSSAEAAALMSDMAAGVAARVIGMGGSPGGAPVYRNGATYIDNKNGTIKGPAEIFAPLAKRNDPEIYQAYQYWAGVQRGSRYMQNPNGTYEEKLFNDPKDIAYANHLLTKFPEFKQVQADWNLYNDGLVDYMVSTGVISKEGGEKFKKYGDYIPFYRQLEGEETIGPKVFQNISGVKPPKKAKGSEAPLADFLETVVRNTQAAIQAGMKNAAAIRTMDMLLDPQIDQATKINKPQGINTVSLLRGGKIEHYHVNDPLLVDSLKSLNLAKLPGLGFLSGPANLLRTLVTKDPGFMLVNLMRDSMSAWVTSGQDFKPGIDTIRYFGKALAGNSPEVEAILNFGMGGYDFSKNVEKSGRDLAATLKKKTQGKRTFGQKVLNVAPSLWEALEKGTTASDMATRAAIYKSVMKETGNETEALMRALEVMNFNRRGNSVVVRIATAAIPFFNARMQGLDVLYRAGIRPYKRQLVNLASDVLKLGLEKQETTDYEKQIAKTFAIRGLAMMAVSSLYWAMTHDDDEYLTQEQELKDNNFLLPSLGLRLPIPFEVGVMFKVIPERLLELSFGKDTGKDFSEAMVRNIKSSLFMDLMPQTIKPIYEVTTNYNFYTRRPIVGQGAEGMAAEYEVGPGTSSFAEGLGKTLGYSPLKLDHLIKAYTGTIGTYGVFLIDSVIDANSNVPKASLRFEQLPFFRRFTLDKDARGKQTAYYDLKNSVDEVVRTVNHLEKAGNYEEMGEYMQDNMRILAAKDYISAIDKEMKSFQEMGNMIRSSKMSGDEKRDALLAVTQARNKLTGNIQEIKKMIASGD